MMMTTETPATRTEADFLTAAHDIGLTLGPGASGRDRDGEISALAFERLRESGITAAPVPLEFGGGGASHAQTGAILRELGRFDPSTAVTLSMHFHLVATQVWRHRHGMDAARIFRKVVEEGALLVSTGASDWIGSGGRAERVSGGFLVSARKSPVSGCEVGDILVTSIRREDGPNGPEVLHCSVPLSAPGVRIERTWDTLGLRATGSHTVVLEDVFVPEAAVSLVRPADRWHPVWNAVLGSAMPLIVSAYLGIADRAVELALASVKGRTEAHVLHLIGEMLNARTTAADVVAAMFHDSDDLRFPATVEYASFTLCRKTVATDSLIETVRLAVEVAGGAAYTRQSDLERLYRDIHGCLFHPLPRGRQLLFSGRVAQGLSPIEVS